MTIYCYRKRFIVSAIQTTNKVRNLAKRSPLISRSEALAVGIPTVTLTRLTKAGTLQRVARGLYQLTDSEGYNHPDILEAALRVPKGVIVLLSALNFHGIGTQNPREVWIQLPANFPTPRLSHPPIRVVRSRIPEAFSEGVETHTIAGRPVRITSVDRTIVDCFKHRNQVTLEVCLEALRERMRDRKDSLQNLHRYAELQGMKKIMQPYMEALA